MARKKELSPADKFYLDNHINNDLFELVEAVKNTPEVVEAYINARKPGLAQDVDRLMAKKERNGQVVSSVMTQAASEAADSAMGRGPNASNNAPARKQNPNMIYRPRG